MEGDSRSGIPPQRTRSYIANLWRKPAVLAYHHRELAVIANLWRKPVVLAYHRRELPVLANLCRKPAVLAYLYLYIFASF
jgi:hypothetical protein